MKPDSSDAGLALAQILADLFLLKDRSVITLDQGRLQGLRRGWRLLEYRPSAGNQGDAVIEPFRGFSSHLL